ncbi:MAG: outer membrane beta-barrel protein [Longimicrobiales bacterium]
MTVPLRRSRHVTGGILLSVLFIVPPPCEGQDLTAGVRFGFAGSTVRFLDQNANDQTELKPGFHLGAAATVPLRSYAEIEASLLIAQGGFRGRGGHPATLETTHLEVPVVLRLRLPWRISPHVTSGLAARFRIGCHLSDVGIVGEAGCEDPVVGTEWKRLDLAVVAGLGAGWEMGPGSVLVEGLLNWGISDMKEGPLPPGWAKSADLRLSTVYRLPVR